MPGSLTLEKSGNDEISLFSLELVVEKLYIPHSPCRFPAIAFRLLDFPTILIKHVEDDLANVIRSKVSIDPYYHIPDQFIDLKDKHGNFMVKKGKSCLFKISANVLKQQLASTPLYVMVIDLFTEVPKLIGNSSIPLNTLIESICTDIVKMGPTVPSVHGDKGLFKIFNLMGKEIGYFVLGFRLLCLGPSLLPHLPESAVTQGKSMEEQHFDQIIDKIQDVKINDKTCEPNVLHKHSSSMTEPFKPTHEMIDKETLANVTDVSSKVAHTTSTQTEKLQRTVQKSQSAIDRWIKHAENEKKEENDFIINNIICPPPMFYNSEASPTIQIQKRFPLAQFDENLSINDLSDIESFDGYGIHKEKTQVREVSKQEEKIPSVSSFYSQGLQGSNVYIPQARQREIVKGLNVAPQPEAVFPLLTALIKELSYIQNPQLLLDVSKKLQSVKSTEQLPESKPVLNKNEKLPLSVVSAVASALTKKLEATKSVTSSSAQVIAIKQQKSQTVVKKENDNDSIKKPKIAVSSSNRKLIFKLNNTQRLRIQKNNPNWPGLKKKESKEPRHQHKSDKKTSDFEEMGVSAFSDTLTEVRRLAAKELNTTVAMGDTLQQLASESELDSTTETVNLKQRQRRARKKSTKMLIGNTHKCKHKLKIKPEKQSSSVELHRMRMKSEKNLTVASAENLNKKVLISTDEEDYYSAQSEALSSRSKSIEVRLPSAEPDPMGNQSGMENEGVSDSDDDIPLPDDSAKEPLRGSIINFAKYLSSNSLHPESIPGAANESLNVSTALDDQSPLESTHHSKSNPSVLDESQVLQSADFDTHQYLSTDEPELQGLVSEEANLSVTGDSGKKSATLIPISHKFPVINPQLSESSPVPSIRRSQTKIDFANFSHLASASDSKDRYSPPSTRAAVSNQKQEKKGDSYKLNPHSGTVTPKITITPRSVSSSPRQGKYPNRKSLRESVHTDSISSYMPSDPDNVIVSLSTSNSGNYSDDFVQGNSGNSTASSVDQLPNIISSAKLGYTIN